METMERPRRGAPPRPEVVERDRRVQQYLEQHGPRTRNALAAELGIEKRLLWLALDRLRKRGAVKMCAPKNGGDMLWMDAAVPCEDPQAAP